MKSNRGNRFINNYITYFIIMLIGIICFIITIWLPSDVFWEVILISLGTCFLSSAITGFLVDLSNRKATEQKVRAIRNFDFEKIFYRVLLLSRKFINIGLHNGDIKTQDINTKPLDEVLGAATEAIINSRVYCISDGISIEDKKQVEASRMQLYGVINQYAASIETECDKMYEMQDLYLINEILSEQEIKTINIIRGLIKEQLDPDDELDFEEAVRNIKQIYDLLSMTFEDIYPLKNYVVEIVEGSGSVVYFLDKHTNKYFIKPPKQDA